MSETYYATKPIQQRSTLYPPDKIRHETILHDIDATGIRQQSILRSAIMRLREPARRDRYHHHCVV